MVLEQIYRSINFSKHPSASFLLGLIFSFFALFLSYIIFPQLSGILAVFFTVLAALPLVHKILHKEEIAAQKTKKTLSLLERHAKTLEFLLFFFFGVTVAFTLVYVFSPIQVTQTIFHFQEQAIHHINVEIQGKVVTGGLLSKIVVNNLKVLLFCFLFSFLYGTGALFILLWNSSIVATAIGGAIREQLGNIASSFGFSQAALYFQIASFGFLRYLLHGVFEISAYFVAGIAGGIVSVAFLRHRATKRALIRDVVLLFSLSLALLLVGALVEVYVTPLLV